MDEGPEAAESYHHCKRQFVPGTQWTGRRLPVQALCERRVLVAVTGYPRGGAPGPGRSFVTRATRNQREIWYMKPGPSRVNYYRTYEKAVSGGGPGPGNLKGGKRRTRDMFPLGSERRGVRGGASE